jgi:hypothetical protein
MPNQSIIPILVDNYSRNADDTRLQEMVSLFETAKSLVESLTTHDSETSYKVKYDNSA